MTFTIGKWENMIYFIPTIIWLSKSPKLFAITWLKWYIGFDEKEQTDEKIFEWLKRNPCKECKYYIVTNNTCQSKKCATYGNHSYVTIIDELFCEPCKEETDGNDD